MKKINVSELPRREKNAHNMIRIPAWIYGGIFIVYGSIYTLVYFVMLLLSRFVPPSEFEDFPFELFSKQARLMEFAPFLLVLGVAFLLLGFLYQKYLNKLRQILWILVGYIGFMFVFIVIRLQAFFDSIIHFIAQDAPELSEPISGLMVLAIIIGVLFGLAFTLAPCITGLIGEKKLRNSSLSE
ncbi:MAG: hypothetical protein PF590_04650 [Candidatus Delongbacteria bacterium]|jgi:hypothetical protein|nr:hypothetical protein [Candidatus Delongbacteria bacterium]